MALVPVMEAAASVGRWLGAVGAMEGVRLADALEHKAENALNAAGQNAFNGADPGLFNSSSNAALNAASPSRPNAASNVPASPASPAVILPIARPPNGVRRNLFSPVMGGGGGGGAGPGNYYFKRRVFLPSFRAQLPRSYRSSYRRRKFRRAPSRRFSRPRAARAYRPQKRYRRMPFVPARSASDRAWNYAVPFQTASFRRRMNFGYMGVPAG